MMQVSTEYKKGTSILPTVKKKENYRPTSFINLCVIILKQIYKNFQ